MSETNKNTITQVLQRIEQKLEQQTPCPLGSTPETYMQHCLILQSLQETIPVFRETLERLDKKYDEHERDITIMKTEKRTVIGIAAFLGALAGWLASIFKNP